MKPGAVLRHRLAAPALQEIGRDEIHRAGPTAGDDGLDRLPGRFLEPQHERSRRGPGGFEELDQHRRGPDVEPVVFTGFDWREAAEREHCAGVAPVAYSG